MKAERLKNLAGKRIGLLGLGLENQSLLRLLDREKIPCHICICDKRSEQEISEILDKAKISKRTIKSVEAQTGAQYKSHLERFDILFRSPGWPLWCPSLDLAKKKKTVTIDSPMNLFFHLCPSKNIIGVTGSKGKGTTASLIAKIIGDSGKEVFLGGNIGIAPLDFLDKLKNDSWIVLELSSFQLEDLECKPKIAVITNLFKEHLAPADPNNPNYHLSLSDYWNSKLNIARNQSSSQILVINKKLRNKIEKEKLSGNIIYFAKSSDASGLMGDFNKENVAAAEKVAGVLKIKEDSYKRTIAAFSNLEHRLEKVRELKGVTYYDNSFSTTPESTRLDILSFNNPIIAIMGGSDKGANFSLLAKSVTKKVKYVIMLPGKGSDRLTEALKGEKYKKIKKVSSMEEAIGLAHKLSRTGDMVLLSTACASFGIFKNYKERGNQFKHYVNKLS